MTTKTLRRLRYVPTGELRKRGTRPLGDTGLLRGERPVEELYAQIDKLLIETERLSARFAAMSDVSVAVNSSLRPEDILEVIVGKVRHAIGFDYCAVGTLNESETDYTLRPLVWPEGNIDAPDTQTFGLLEGLPGAVVSSGKPLMVQNLTERPLKVRPARFIGLLHPALEGRLAAAGMRSLMVVPMITSGRVLGCLSFAKTDADYYNQDDLQLAYLFSMVLATALHNSKLFDAESRRSHQLQMLTEIGQTATSILDTSILLAKIPPLVQTYFGYDVAKIGVLEDDEVVYASAAQVISGCPHPVDTRIPVSRNGMPVGIVGLAAFTGQMVLVPNVFEDDRWADVADSLSGPHIRSVLVIPMTARDRVLGVLHFESERTDVFSAADVTILQSMANQLGVALDNARLYQQINDLFRGYVAPQVASTLLDNPMNAELGGQKREVTALFADLDGFTSLSEQVPPEELLELLNACLSVATDAILEYGGMLDKYMGDAVMALFNVPEDQPDHAWRAVRAAITMQRKIAKLTEKWEHKMIFAIGLNTGEAVVGNIGSETLRDYTAIGDTINLAKRIQEAAGPGQIMVSQSTYSAALTSAPAEVKEDSSLITYRLGTRPLKGRTRPAVIYEVSPHAAPLKSSASQVKLAEPLNVFSMVDDWSTLSGPISGHLSGALSGPISGPIEGPLDDPTLELDAGPINGPLSGSLNGPVSGPIIGPLEAPISGPLSGSLNGPVSGPIEGPLDDPTFDPAGWPINGPLSGALGGPVSGPIEGPLDDPTLGLEGESINGPLSGALGGPVSGPIEGPLDDPTLDEAELVEASAGDEKE